MAMGRWRFARLVRHPVVASVIAAALFPVASKLTSHAIYVAQLYAASDDPAKISDLRLAHRLDRESAEREIRSALADDKVDLTQSFVDLSESSHLSIDPALLDKVKAASSEANSIGTRVRDVVHGFWTGEVNNNAALAGTVASDVLYFGDVRDLTKETVHYAMGQPYDPWVLGMSGAGVVATSATFFVGTGLPERLGLSVAKIARRRDRLNPALAARLVKATEDGTVVELAENAANIERRAGMQATLDSLALVEKPEDLARIDKLAASKGSKTGAILKVLGRMAFEVGLTGWTVAKWAAIGAVASISFLLWAATALLGILGWCVALIRRVVRLFFPSRAATGVA
jgi:hypothetical protein